MQTHVFRNWIYYCIIFNKYLRKTYRIIWIMVLHEWHWTQFPWHQCLHTKENKNKLQQQSPMALSTNTRIQQREERWLESGGGRKRPSTNSVQHPAGGKKGWKTSRGGDRVEPNREVLARCVAAASSEQQQQLIYNKAPPISPRGRGSQRADVHGLQSDPRVVLLDQSQTFPRVVIEQTRTAAQMVSVWGLL